MSAAFDPKKGPILVDAEVTGPESILNGDLLYVPMRRIPMSTAQEPIPTPGVIDPIVYGRPVVVEVLVRVKALAFREAEGGYSVVVPEIDGCVTQGETIEEVERMAKELAEALLEMRHDEKREAATRLLTDPMPGEAGR